jgi:hypothetical protein
MDSALRNEIDYLLGEEEGTRLLSLEGEISAAREVLAGLMGLWRHEGVTVDDARRLAALVFSGARTIAILLAHQSRLAAPEEDNGWLIATLEEMEKETIG